jgi:murein DD-endopeptidase MepM/ murein hydrolase activator NlpD
MPYNFPGFTPSHEFREPRPKSKFGFHGGQDLSARSGTPVPARFSGTVFRSGAIHGYGNAVIVESIAPNGKVFYTLYGHLGADGLPAVGTDIKGGTSVLGTVGSEAFVNSFPGAKIKGSHLHLEIISGKAKIAREGSLGIVSSDVTHRADPETFNIGNPFFLTRAEILSLDLAPISVTTRTAIK